MYNLRYHLASLVAVFLALAIGVILGGLIVDNSPAFDTDKIIRDLQAEYDQLRADNESLQARTDALEALSGTLATPMYAGALSGGTVAVLSTDSSVSDHAVTALSGAGAATVVIEIDSAKVDPDAIDSDLAAALTEAGVDVAGGGVGAIAVAAIDEWTSTDATSTPVTAALIAANVLRADGVDGTTTPIPSLVGLVNTAVLNDKADPFGLALSVAFSERGLPAVGASMVGGAVAVASASWDDGVAGVGTLGSALGSHSIVALMLGGEPGLYGLMDGATAAFAAMPTPAQ